MTAGLLAPTGGKTVLRLIERKTVRSTGFGRKTKLKFRSGRVQFEILIRHQEEM